MFELVKKIKAVIDEYHANSKQLVSDIKRIVEEWGNAVNEYKIEYIQEQIRKEIEAARADAEKVNIILNQQINVILEDAKKKAIPELYVKRTKPSDYGILINNALQFLALEGEQITDSSAFMILKDFIDDLDQMKLFKNVIGKKIELINANGENVFPLTFGKLNKVQMLINTFDEMEAIAKTIFILPRVDGQRFIVNGKSYSIPNDSYEQITGEESILSYSEIIEKYVNKNPNIDSVAHIN